MQITVKRETLVKNVQSTLGIVDKRGVMPILAHCLVKAENGQISISATDLEVSYRGSLEAEVKEEGAFTVQAHTFASVLKTLPEATLTLNAGNGHVTLEAGESRYKFNTIDPDQFPLVPEPDEAVMVSIESKPLLEMIEQTAFSVSADHYNYFLSGIFWEKLEYDGETYLRLVSTDGHRLSVSERPMPEVARLDLGGGILVPIKAVVEIARFLKENAKEATVLVGVKDKALHLLARWSGEHFSVRLVEKRFPDYRRIIPQQQHEHGFIFNRQELAGALKRLSLLSNERFKGVVFDLELSHAFLSHENPEVGQGKEAVQAVFHADQPLKLGFNARYVLDALDAIKGDEVAMDVMGPGRPVRFWGDDGNSFFLVMPMTL